MNCTYRLAARAFTMIQAHYRHHPVAAAKLLDTRFVIHVMAADKENPEHNEIS